jgi:hypothetical protein
VIPTGEIFSLLTSEERAKLARAQELLSADMQELDNETSQHSAGLPDEKDGNAEASNSHD